MKCNDLIEEQTTTTQHGKGNPGASGRIYVRKGSIYLQDDEEFISRLSLHYNLLSVLKLDGLQGISNCQTLPFVKRLCVCMCGRKELASHLIEIFFQVRYFYMLFQVILISAPNTSNVLLFIYFQVAQ